MELLQNAIEPLVDFLREKTAAYREIKQQKSKLPAKQQEQESQQQNDESCDDSAATTE